MRAVVLSLIAACYLFGASNDPQSILAEVVKLREKYEECRQQQLSSATADPSAKIKGYQKRIDTLGFQLEQSNKELSRLKKTSNDLERELSQKKGVIASLEKTLNARDKGYREAVEENEKLITQTNSVKVSRIERQKLTSSLEKAKFEVERLESIVSKITKEKIALEKELSISKTQIDKYRHTPPPPLATKAPEPVKPSILGDQSGKIKALQSELARANAYIQKLQTTATQPNIQEKIVEKVVYKDRIIEPTEKVAALQRELSAAQVTIANLKKSSKIVTQEKIVEKVVYKDRPVVQERTVTKVVEPTEKINALQRELAAAQAKLINLKNSPSNTVVKEKIVEKVVYKDRPVIQEKIVEKVVYKERPVIQEKIVEKVVMKNNDVTEKLNRALEQKLAENEVQIAKLKASSQKLTPPKTTKLSAPSVALSEKTKTLKAPETKTMNPSASVTTAKKGNSSAYRISGNAPIYNAPGGTQVDTWEDRRSFTAGNPSNGWVHITGYFVNRVWTPTGAGENLYVRESDVIRR